MVILPLNALFLVTENAKRKNYRNDSNFLDIHVLANIGDLDQTAPKDETDCCSVCIIWRYHTMVEPLSLNFRVFTVNLEGVQKFRNLTVTKVSNNGQIERCSFHTNSNFFLY